MANRELDQDINLLAALAEHMNEVKEKVAEGKYTWKDFYSGINRVADEQGCVYGMPLPVFVGEEIKTPITAQGTPLHPNFGLNLTAMAEDLLEQGIPVRNSWSTLGDKTVCVVNTEKGPMYLPEYHAGTRLRMFMNGLSIRMASYLNTEAEISAMLSLKEKLKPQQWRCYVLNGAFIERSKRSDIYYFFRKGFPTLAVSFHGTNADGGKVLAALCLHPMGYWPGTFAGVMTPTDEVITHLLLMRTNERKYWAKCGQWNASDLRSGL